MSSHRRVYEAGDAAIVLELGTAPTAPSASAYDVDLNRAAIGIAADLRAKQPRGVRDIVPAYRSVAIYFDPVAADFEELSQALLSSEPSFSEPGRDVEVPVVYGGEAGPDLDDVASFAGCTTADVIQRHTSRAYRVFMLGFLPGFPYMAAVDDSIAAPRRATPRVRVPAGSVGIAGHQTGIYPSDSPGGWQIIGRTPLTLFDETKTPPAFFAPGDIVRFVSVAASGVGPSSATPTVVEAGSLGPSGVGGSRLGEKPDVTVLTPGLLTTVQDTGRWGHQHLGVPPAGPMDPSSHRFANQLAGNAEDAAALEVTLIGPELKFEQPVTLAIAGADLSARVGGATVDPGMSVDCKPGDVLEFGSRRAGGRAYLAFAGGIDSAPVLGSRATHVQSAMGGHEGRLLRAGDCIHVGAARRETRTIRSTRAVPPAGGARLRVMRGPQADFFDSISFDALERSRFIVSPQSNRMGYRLTGTRLPVASRSEMISGPTFTGAVQVPPSGDPILLMADRQTTGGYPQIAVVITADLPLAGQLLPGDWIEFELCTRSAAINALRAQQSEHDVW